MSLLAVRAAFRGAAVGRLIVVLTMLVAAASSRGEPLGVQQLGELSYHPERTAPATVISLNEATISAQLNAQIEAIPVQVGDRVEAGGLLVKLDCADYEINLRVAEARLHSAQARLRLAQSQLDRFERLLAQQLTSQEDVDARAADRDALAAGTREQQAATDSARLSVARCEVKAPYTALVGERLAAKGQLANVGTALVKLIDRENIELSAQVSAGDAGLLNDVKSLSFDNGARWPVEIRSVLNAVNPATRNREVRLTFTGKSPLPGEAGKLVWRDPRPFLPSKYIVERQGRYGLFLAQQGSARFMTLEGAQPGRDYPVDLPMDSAVVVAGLATLKDGDLLPVGVR